MTGIAKVVGNPMEVGMAKELGIPKVLGMAKELGIPKVLGMATAVCCLLDRYCCSFRYDSLYHLQLAACSVGQLVNLMKGISHVVIVSNAELRSAR